ncbi:hypothetical protein BFJ63_vAg17284 [Fusarium oxysporum f. sp. narcissi]|uniref:Uncharacterized protein n=1 Tax=Fusarium oxysporum f. sp. narcissi TaxID=451672 RepID=A0A4Q2V057_FUSOX|nr:hypothetical protein DER44DRAFT_832444 [Fusarium oxysporum]RYC79834.1 hypothetical protein BFJ63_vAg17284 [Fusarium oxysporum f. sp. narcissi]
MSRSTTAKQRLREEAEKQINGRDDVQLAPDETTAEDDFKYERSPQVRGVVVDLGSESGYVQISGGGKPTVKITTGLKEGEFHFENISDGQSCMLYGRPTVWYIVPRL